MDLINLLGSVWPEGNLWASIIKLFDVGSYAWTVILFTIVLKLVLSPIDFAQRYFTNKQTRAQARLQPELEKLKKRYGQNQTLLYQKQNELYQKNNVKMGGSCVVMLVYLAVTLTVFLTLWNSLQFIAGFKIENQYKELQTVYSTSYESNYLDGCLHVLENYNQAETEEEKNQIILDAEADMVASLEGLGSTNEEAVAAVAEIKQGFIEKAQIDVVNRYLEIKDGWLWVKNIWRPDKPTTNEIPDYAAFKSYAKNTEVKEADYNLVMGKLLNNYNNSNQKNGYYILSVIVVGVSLLSQMVNKMLMKGKNKKGETVKMQTPGFAKVMIFILPLTMLMFTISSSAVFAIYIIMNSLMTTIITPLSTILCNKIEDMKEKKHQEEIKVEYRR